MSVKLLTEHHLEFLILKGGCTGLSDSTLVKMPNCWKSHTRDSGSDIYYKFIFIQNFLTMLLKSAILGCSRHFQILSLDISLAGDSLEMSNPYFPKIKKAITKCCRLLQSWLAQILAIRNVQVCS